MSQLNLRSIRLGFWVLLLASGSMLKCHAGVETNRFGFTGPEIFPIDILIGQLRAADVDGDGLQDLLIVNNGRSKINILFNRTGKSNQLEAAISSLRREANQLPPGARFRIDSIASEKRISSFVVADLNEDGRPDIAYYGEPKELVLQYNEGTNRWSSPRRWPVGDGQVNLNALASGDLNGDKRTDLVMLGESHAYFFAQQPDHSFGEPEKIPISGTVKAVQILDIDGDGLDDLLLVNWDSSNPFRFRLQGRGNLGPETHFSLPPIRSYWADDLDGDRKTEIITVALKSGRAQISSFTKKQAETLSGTFLQGQFQVMPLNKTTKARRGILWADINSDQLPDLLVAEPDSGQLTVYFQQKNGEFDAPKTFPTLTGVTDLAVADWDGKDNLSIFLLSADERQVGVTKLDANGRIPFPTLLPLTGRPLELIAGFIQDTNKPTLAVILDQDDKRILQFIFPDGKTTSQKLGENFKSNPTSFAIHDVDQDGHPDLIILIPYEKIKILRQVPDKAFEEYDVAPPGGSVEQPWLSAADIDGDGKTELLLAQKNFLRAVVLRSDRQKSESEGQSSWFFHVKEQINGASSNSRILGAAPLRNGSNAIASLFLLDAERKSLTLCERDTTGVWQVIRNIELPVADFSSLEPIALGTKIPNSIVFAGLNTIAWMSFQGETWAFTELDGYESPIKDGFLTDVVSGDLNQDNRKDLVFLETAKNYLDVVTFEAPHRLVPANRWQVFEERTFRSRRSDGMEPREALIVDMTGDGKNDLVVVVHDRILVYPQE